MIVSQGLIYRDALNTLRNGASPKTVTMKIQEHDYLDTLGTKSAQFASSEVWQLKGALITVETWAEFWLLRWEKA